ncbi:MAG: hypothetical protein JNL21_03945 [Myxococcales bacterium]|nr:hypothetical protein [Myxococcales bacterium]
MATSAMTPVPFQAEHVQALALRGHGDLNSASYELFRITDAPAARGWLGAIADRVSYLETEKQDKREASPARRKTRLQVALTAQGMAELGLKAHLATFPIEFQLGMAARAHALGDERDEIQSWDYGSGNKPIHVMLLLFAGTDEEVAAFARAEIEEAERRGLTHFATQTTLRYESKDRIFEHFGFRDGLVQPSIDLEGHSVRADDGTPGPDPSHKVPLGEVVLGQLNAYKYRTIGPSVPNSLDARGFLPDFLSSGRKDLGAHGTYLVLRKLEQDVAGFWLAIDRAAESLGVDPEWLAAKMVGRWKNGSAVVNHPNEPGPPPVKDTPGISFASDRHGFRCPVGAHIRRSNPRDDLGDDVGKSLELVGRHRLIRRGRVYGPRLADSRKDDGKKRGLVFITVGASIRRQFEFVQNLWVTNTTFRGLNGEDDPVVGPRCPAFFGAGKSTHAEQTSPFSLQAHPVQSVVPALPRFVTMRGGDYFFLPSVPALRFIAAL